MASTLVRAIVTGFGLKLGSEIAKVLSQKLSEGRFGAQASAEEEDDDDDGLPGTSADPPTFDGGAPA